MPDWKNLKDKAMAAVNNAAQEVDRQIALTKLRANVAQAQSEQEKALAALGTAVYQSFKSQGAVDMSDAAIAELVGKVDDSESKVDAAQQALKMANLGTDASHCPSCGAAVDPSAKFCPDCGKPVA